MNTGVYDTDVFILNQLNFTDLYAVCTSNKMAVNICKSNALLYNKIKIYYDALNITNKMMEKYSFIELPNINHYSLHRLSIIFYNIGQFMISNQVLSKNEVINLIANHLYFYPNYTIKVNLLYQF
jgi:hypothetical protein